MENYLLISIPTEAGVKQQIIKVHMIFDRKNNFYLNIQEMNNTFTSEIYRSNNTGWEKIIGNGILKKARIERFDVLNFKNKLYMVDYGKVLVSEDNGNNFEILDSGLSSLAFAYKLSIVDSNLYLSTEASGLWGFDVKKNIFNAIYNKNKANEKLIFNSWTRLLFSSFLNKYGLALPL